MKFIDAIRQWLIENKEIIEIVLSTGIFAEILRRFFTHRGMKKAKKINYQEYKKRCNQVRGQIYNSLIFPWDIENIYNQSKQSFIFEDCLIEPRLFDLQSNNKSSVRKIRNCSYLVIGEPGAGKSTFCKNIFLSQTAPFDLFSGR